MIAEPWTFWTDVGLGGLSGAIGLWLVRRARPVRCAWPAVFFLGGAAAFLGALAHGFGPVMARPLLEAVWRSCLLFLVAAAWALAKAALIPALPAAGRTWVRALLIPYTLSFAVWSQLRTGFLIPLIAYGLVLLALFPAHVTAAARDGAKGTRMSRLILASVFASLAAAAVQRMTGLHLGPMNHNDVYHLIQAVGLVLLGLAAAADDAPEAVIAPLIPPADRSRGLILFYDGHCGLCHRLVKDSLHRDAHGILRYAPLQGETLARMIPEAERAALPDSAVVILKDGTRLLRSQAIRALMEGWGGLWRVGAACMSIAPTALWDAKYDFVARLRGRLFRKPEQACPMVPAELRDRFLP